MLVTLDAIELGFKNWYMREIATMSWKTMFTSPIINLALANYRKKFASSLNMLLDDNGMVDIDELHKEYSALLNQNGGVEVFGIKFNAQDLDKLKAYITNATPAEMPTKL